MNLMEIGKKPEMQPTENSRSDEELRNYYRELDAAIADARRNH